MLPASCGWCLPYFAPAKLPFSSLEFGGHFLWGVGQGNEYVVPVFEPLLWPKPQHERQGPLVPVISL